MKSTGIDFIDTINSFHLVKYAAENCGYVAQLVLPYSLIRMGMSVNLKDKESFIKSLKDKLELNIFEIFKLKNRFAFVIVYKQ